MISDSCYNYSRGITLVLRWYELHASEIAWPILIFVRKRTDVEQVSNILKGHHNLRAAGIHGGHTKARRAGAQADLKSGKLQCVVCTDAWMAGVDIPNLRGVVIACGGSAPIGLKQRSGRGTRLSDGKPKFTIWDLADASDRHREKRIKNYLDGGYEVQGLVMRDGRVLDSTRRADMSDSDLKKLFERPKRSRSRSGSGSRSGKQPSGWHGVREQRSGSGSGNGSGSGSRYDPEVHGDYTVGGAPADDPAVKRLQNICIWTAIILWVLGVATHWFTG